MEVKKKFHRPRNSVQMILFFRRHSDPFCFIDVSNSLYFIGHNCKSKQKGIQIIDAIKIRKDIIFHQNSNNDC